MAYETEIARLRQQLASGVARTATSGLTVENRSAQEQIEALRYFENQQAATSNSNRFRLQSLRSPGGVYGS